VNARFWCELAWLGGDDVAAGVSIDVAGDRIAAIATDVARPLAGARVLPGVTLPGLANAHSHAFHRALRSRTQRGTGSFWSWREQMLDLAGRLDPDRYLALATAAYAEMALAGYTVVGEFHYLHHAAGGVPYADPNAMGGVLVEAARRAGVRLTLLDTCYLQGGLDPAGAPLPLASVQRRFADRDVDAWCARVGALADADTLRIGAAAHSVRAVDPDALAVVSDWARTRGAPFHVHVSEQPAENEQCLAAHGRTPTGLLASRGALGPSTTLVHATHLTDADVSAIGGAGAFCCICPTTERDLADGVGPTSELVAAGARLCLGSDSHAVVDGFEEARAVELDERLRSMRRGTHQPVELLRAATAAGYAGLGWPEGGRLEAGALADFVTVRLDEPRLAGASRADVVPALVFAATAADVDHVVVGGRTVVDGGRHVAVDVSAALRVSIEALRP
jgi:formiminoglutamate deiminase